MLSYIFVCILYMMFMYGQKEAARFLELESQMIMSHLIGAGNQTTPSEEQRLLLINGLSLQPYIFILYSSKLRVVYV